MTEESWAPSKWPTVIGTLGVVLGALMVLDTLDDLLFQLFWNEENWAAWVGRIAGDFPGATQAEVQSAALVGVAMASLLLLAYPLFLLHWFSKEAIQGETAAWVQ